MNYWLLGLSAGLLGISAYAWWRQKYPPTKRAMKQYAQDPRARRRMSAMFAERDELLAKAQRMTEKQIERMVRDLLDTDGTAEQPNLRLG